MGEMLPAALHFCYCADYPYDTASVTNDVLRHIRMYKMGQILGIHGLQLLATQRIETFLAMPPCHTHFPDMQQYARMRLDPKSGGIWAELCLRASIGVRAVT